MGSNSRRIREPVPIETETGPTPPAASRVASTDLVLRGVNKTYGTFRAVSAMDLVVRDGEFLTLLGPSGSGKTTLLMMIAGFVDPSAGQILLDGVDMVSLLPERRGFGMVFQGYALFPHMTVAQNIAYPLEIRHMDREAIRRRVDEMLDLVQLKGLETRHPRQLSGGQQQRVALARALSFKPRLLLLDEPLGALDRKLRADVQAQLKDLHLRTGTTFIYVTHDQDEALSMSDRIAIMNHGRVVQLGSPAELYERPASVFAASFLGKSNFVRARVVGLEPGGLQLEAGGHRFRQLVDGPQPPVGEAVMLAIRPEKVTLHDAARRPAQSIGAVVQRVTYLGSLLEVDLAAPGIGDVTASVPARHVRESFTPGQSVAIAWDETAAVVVRDDSEPQKP